MVMPELLSDHFPLAISIPLGNLMADRNTIKRLFLHKDKTGYFLESIQNWHKNYNPESVDKFYEDMVRVIYDLLRWEEKKY